LSRCLVHSITISDYEDDYFELKAVLLWDMTTSYRKKGSSEPLGKDLGKI
jgi:hypothetical protein